MNTIITKKFTGYKTCKTGSFPCKWDTAKFDDNKEKDKSVVYLAGAARSYTPISVIYLHSGG